MEVRELYELRTLSVTRQTEVLEDRRRDIALVPALSRCRPVRKSYQFKLVGEQRAAIFLYDPVDDEHEQLAQSHCRRGRRHSPPRFMQLKTVLKRIAGGPSVN
jgi:hypothetical protein